MFPQPGSRWQSVALCAGWVSCSAGAQVAPASLPANATPLAADCARLQPDAQRLACYDALFDRPATGAAAGSHTDREIAPPHGALARANTAAPLPSTNALSEDARHRRERLGSNLSDRWELDHDPALGTFVPRPYKPVYVLPLSLTSRVNEAPFTASSNPAGGSTTTALLQPAEAMFQLSLKTKAVEDLLGSNGDLWFGYTQSSRWQVYNGKLSRPFRETNYEPEAMLMFHLPYQIFGWQAQQMGLSLNHQSNGRSDPLSRSWNRLIGEAGWDMGKLALTLRPWWRIPEKASDDDNPQIADYAGRMEGRLSYHLGKQLLVLQARHSLRGGARSRGSAQLEWSAPLTGQLNGYLQLFTGYGDSLIDYNHRQTRIGLGVSLIEWQ